MEILNYLNEEKNQYMYSIQEEELKWNQKYFNNNNSNMNNDY